MAEKQIDTEALINIPIYFTHAENDPTCSVNSSLAMYQAPKNLGAEHNQIAVWSDEEMAEAGISNALGGALLHWSRVKVLNGNEEGDPMPWLFEQVKVTEVVTPDTPADPVSPDVPVKSAAVPSGSASAGSVSATRSASTSVSSVAGMNRTGFTALFAAAAAGAAALLRRRKED